ncbi:DEAD/DEAH box helicase [Limnochorda pilosa]|uniref:RNA helicase n=1 Tax=Limnochorda pilosa TaxID=1555112 RepID=A0A0K2SQ97_LIMPI|nr:DEAD/DEAH box helicase [Limnochorda pilosa]BAS29303.1 RNA helicase [Limnochorda pilosa]
MEQPPSHEPEAAGHDFTSFDLKPPIRKAIKTLGFTRPTPIQAQVIQPLLEGRDLVGQAQTGSGKTAAYGIPLIQRLSHTGAVQALVIVPTRELAIQVTQAIQGLAQFTDLKLLAVYGGYDMTLQRAALRAGVDLAVSTPGRLMDHVWHGTIELDRVSAVVLDEADEMLSMGFIDDVEQILSWLPPGTQKMLFSATLPEQVRRLAQRFLNQPVSIRVADTEETVPDIAQAYSTIPAERRIHVLCDLLRDEAVQQALVFCRTKEGVDHLARQLQQRRIPAESIHSNLTQERRTAVMNRFRRGSVRVLVATDVASRGIDVRRVSHVINYDCPRSADEYVHRIGRTGRAGRSGSALTFVRPGEMRILKAIEKRVGRKLDLLPAGEPAEEKRARRDG